MARGSKYNNQIRYVDGFRFDSIAESLRYQELKLLLAAGEICRLRLQPKYELQPGFSLDGKRIRAIHYVADFEYYDNAIGEIVTEDVKGVQTAVFRLKHKLFQKRYGRSIRIVLVR